MLFRSRVDGRRSGTWFTRWWPLTATAPLVRLKLRHWWIRLGPNFSWTGLVLADHRPAQPRLWSTQVARNSGHVTLGSARGIAELQQQGGGQRTRRLAMRHKCAIGSCVEALRSDIRPDQTGWRRWDSNPRPPACKYARPGRPRTVTNGCGWSAARSGRLRTNANGSGCAIDAPCRIPLGADKSNASV